MTILNKIYFYKKIEILNNWRKFLDDWGMDLQKWDKYRKVLLTTILFIILTLSILSSMIMNFNQVDMKEVLTLFNIFFLLSIILNSVTYFSNNETVFFEDNIKILNLNAQFRFIKVISSFIYSMVKTLVVWMLIYTPLYFTANSLSLESILVFLKLLLLLSLSLVLGISLTSLISFLIHKRFLIQSRFTFLKFFKHSIFMLFTFVSLYTFISLLLNNNNLNNISEIISFLNAEKLMLILDTLINNNSIFGLFIIISSLLIYITLYLWHIYLMNNTLILYNQYDYNKKSYAENILKSDKIFFTKDIIHFRRLKGWLLSYLLKMLYVNIILAAILIPLTLKFWNDSNQAYLTISIVLSMSMYQLLGDSLKIILSVDAEKNHIYILLNKSKNLWFIIKEKWLIYCCFSLIISILLGLIAFVFSFDLLIALSMTIISFTYGNMSGLFQISTTALFPKLNWEHYHEIGQSKKGKIYDDYLSYMLAIFYSLSLLVIFIPDVFSLNIREDYLIYTMLTIYLTFNVLVIILTKTFLSKKSFEESFKR